MKLFLIGGFLGSGKTTAIQNACAELLKKQIKVGVITNDQGTQLVDTRFFKNANVPVMEVTDGCFCCNYEKLDSLIEVLRKTNQTNVVFAESVGSCTDLIATVVKPLQKFREDIEMVISVFVDANVLPTILQGSPLFIENVSYIYKKQIEEADVLVVNKIDLLDEDQLKKIKQLIHRKFPGKTVLYQNSLERYSVNQWITALTNFKTKIRKSLKMDYDIYGAGEAALAWLDAEIELFTDNKNAFNAGTILIKEIYSEINTQKLPIGHLKFFIDDGKQQQKISFTAENQTSSTDNVESVSGKVDILINARVQTDPDHLKILIYDVIHKMEQRDGFKVIEKGVASFKPGYPKPTHRVFD